MLFLLKKKNQKIKKSPKIQNNKNNENQQKKTPQKQKKREIVKKRQIIQNMKRKKKRYEMNISFNLNDIYMEYGVVYGVVE